MTSPTLQPFRWVERTVRLLFFAGLFFVIDLRIGPQLIYQSQEPPFFTEFSFFRMHLQVPGGIADYLGALCSQILFFRPAGSVLLLLFMLALWFLTARLLKNGSSGAWTLSLVPCLFLLILHSHYVYPLSSSVAMLLALAGALVYFSFKNISPLAKGALFLILVSLLDFTAGAWFLCFAFLAAIREISLRKHAWL